MSEDGEDERKVRHSVDTHCPQPQEDTITGRLYRTRQRAAVQLPSAVNHRQSFVDLQESLVARERSRHLELRPTNVDLNEPRANVNYIFFKLQYLYFTSDHVTCNLYLDKLRKSGIIILLSRTIFCHR